MIVFLKGADGTEEIPENVVGVVLSHELPLLSHLAIRARQAKVPFVCCENADYYAELLGKVLL